VTQLPVILNSDVFINFFLNAQKETQRETETQVDLSVYLMNSDKITVQIQSYDHTEDLLEVGFH
jgi:sRNA-binding regulator protein Hfq